MSRLNKQLIKARLYYLIDNDEEAFLDRMSIYLQERPKLMDFLFEGPLPINKEIEQRIEEYIKADIPCNDYFDKIVKIEIDFDYNLNQQYLVTYKATRFYDQNKQPWDGQPTADNAHQIPVITELTTYVAPENIKI